MLPSKDWVVTIDSGENAGVGLWINGTLVRAELLKMKSWHNNDFIQAWRKPKLLIVEIPKIYQLKGKSVQAKPNDLVTLAYRAGLLAGLFDPQEVRTVYPSDWKGNVPKSVMNARVWDRLDNAERQAVLTFSKGDHNVLDGVGIGLHHFGRLKRRAFVREGDGVVAPDYLAMEEDT